MFSLPTDLSSPWLSRLVDVGVVLSQAFHDSQQAAAIRHGTTVLLLFSSADEWRGMLQKFEDPHVSGGGSGVTRRAGCHACWKRWGGEQCRGRTVANLPPSSDQRPQAFCGCYDKSGSAGCRFLIGSSFHCVGDDIVHLSNACERLVKTDGPRLR